MSNLFLFCMVTLALFSSLVIGYFWVSGELESFEFEMKLQKQQYIDSQKSLLKNEIDHAIEYIRYKQTLTEKRLRDEIKERVIEAHKVASSIYDKNKKELPDSQIIELIKNALRPVRFFDHRNYYFIDDLDGNSILYPPVASFEGSNLIHIKNKAGLQPFPDIIKLVKEKGEGYYVYNWVKYTENKKPTEKEFPKVTYFKHFKPYNWFIAVGEYQDYVEADIRREILNRLANISYRISDHIVVLDEKGRFLVKKGTMSENPRKAYEDIDSLKLAANKPEGVFLKSFNPTGDFTEGERIGFVRYFPDWKWFVGGTVDLGFVDRLIKDKRESLLEKIRRKILRNMVILVAILLLTILVARFISTKTRSSFGTFSNFFQKAATDTVKIDANELHFSEFKDLSNVANEMVNKRIETERDLEEAYQELKGKNQELEQVVYVASHDLRSPLVNVQGFTRELQHSLQNLSQILKELQYPEDDNKTLEIILGEDIPESLHFILTGVDKMDKLLAGLLRISRLGRAALNISSLDMNKLLFDVTQELDYEINKSGALIKVGELPPCQGDSVQINQVFTNLLVNALKYLKHDRQGIIKVSGEIKNGTAIYCVSDNGIGIMKQHQEKIFQIFHRLAPDKSMGEGLGLTIVKKILDRHNGNISIESEFDHGSNFYISLPKG